MVDAYSARDKSLDLWRYTNVVIDGENQCQLEVNRLRNGLEEVLMVFAKANNLFRSLMVCKNDLLKCTVDEWNSPKFQV